MHRRKFGVVIGLAAAMPHVMARAQTASDEEWIYLGVLKGVSELVTFGVDGLSIGNENEEDLAFSFYRFSVVSRAGREMLSAQTPPSSQKTNHRDALSLLQPLADAEQSIQEAIGRAAFAEAVRLGQEALAHAEEVTNRLGDGESAQVAPTPAKTPPRPTSTPISSRRPTATGVTLANFNRLREGMTYQEVVSILGSRGELVSSTTLVGITTEMYMWEGDSLGANMNAMFQDGKLISKAQFGLD